MNSERHDKIIEAINSDSFGIMSIVFLAFNIPDQECISQDKFNMTFQEWHGIRKQFLFDLLAMAAKGLSTPDQFPYRSTALCAVFRYCALACQGHSWKAICDSMRAGAAYGIQTCSQVRPSKPRPRPKSSLFEGLLRKGGIYIKKESISIVALLIIGIFLSCPAMSMSNADKEAIELTTIMALNGTGDFNYVNSDVDDENNLTIWYVPKESDENATIKTLGVIIGVYLGVIQSNSDISDAYIFVGTEGDEKGSLYCLRSWVPNKGNLTDGQIANLVLRIFGTFEDLS